MKLCPTCKILKDESEFYKNARMKDGLSTQCKSCQRAYYARPDVQKRNKDYNSQYYETHKEQSKQYAEKHKEQRRETMTRWRKTNQEHIRQYQEQNKERAKATNKVRREQRQKYYEEHKQEIEKRYPTKICAKCKQLLSRAKFTIDVGNTDFLRSICRDCQRKYDKQVNSTRRYIQYYAKHREMILARAKERGNSIVNRINLAMSSGITKALKEQKAERHWETLVNYTLEDLILHLEQQFTSEMTWDNYGEYWEIDHIIPKGTFDFSSEQDSQFKVCWSLKNLRPLSVIENRQRPKDGSDIQENIKIAIMSQVF